eukprot:745874_1
MQTSRFHNQSLLLSAYSPHVRIFATTLDVHMAMDIDDAEQNLTMAMDIDISEQLINYNYLEFGRFWFDDMNDTHDTKSLLLYHDTFVSNGCDLSLLIEEKSDDFIESCLRTTMPKHSSVVDYQTVLFIIQKIEHLRVQHEQFTSILNYCNCISHLALFKQYAIHTVRAFLSRFES